MASNFSLDIGTGLFLCQNVVEYDGQKHFVFGEHPNRDVQNPLDFVRRRPFFTAHYLFDHRIEIAGRQNDGVGEDFLFVFEILIDCGSRNLATVGDFLVRDAAVPLLGEERKRPFENIDPTLLMVNESSHTRFIPAVIV
jgi:hypothetical protein